MWTEAASAGIASVRAKAGRSAFRASASMMGWRIGSTGSVRQCFESRVQVRSNFRHSSQFAFIVLERQKAPCLPVPRSAQFMSILSSFVTQAVSHEESLGTDQPSTSLGNKRVIEIQ